MTTTFLAAGIDGARVYIAADRMMGHFSGFKSDKCGLILGDALPDASRIQEVSLSFS
jgi:hypothetical protein